MQTSMSINGEMLKGGGAPISVVNPAIRAMRMSLKLRNGIPWVNTHGVAAAEMPGAAMKSAGIGCDMSIYASDAHTVTRHVMGTH
ncbi:hypothetical protein [Nioella ostreopsis]|uniref:hypothetical protein n=1 Tax=Nioella ostreopsis TaxID=2448479 RepID=UPI000FD8CC28|nr:hypothetical protein [Nioella ostreopsis]